MAEQKSDIPRDHFRLELDLRTAEGTPVEDGRCTVNIKQQDGQDYRRLTGTTKNGIFVEDVSLPDPPETLSWECLCERFHPHLGTFFMPQEQKTELFTATLFRIPGQWKPTFVPLKSLAAPRFDRLREVLAVSDDVDLKTTVKLGDLNKQFDLLEEGPASLGKMALLNLYSVLTDERDPINECAWFDNVRRVVRLDQERFIAEVTVDLYESVQALTEQIDTWKANGYFLETSTCLHKGNIPSNYPLPEETISIKWHYQQGNLQLTMSKVLGPELPTFILDCDMDEHANMVLHGADIGKHDFTGGTAPVEMFDYISLHAANKQADRVSRCDLGYALS